MFALCGESRPAISAGIKLVHLFFPTAPLTATLISIHVYCCLHRCMLVVYIVVLYRVEAERVDPWEVLLYIWVAVSRSTHAVAARARASASLLWVGRSRCWW